MKNPTYNRHCFNGIVSYIIFLVLGPHNAKNPFGENNNGGNLQRETGEISFSGVGCECAHGVKSHLNRMVNPLTDSEQEQGEEQKDEIALGYGRGCECNGRNRACSTDNSEGVPPVIYLKPGERITHFYLPNVDQQPRAFRALADWHG